MTFCKQITVDGVMVRIQFRSQKDADNVDAEQLKKQAQAFIDAVRKIKPEENK